MALARWKPMRELNTLQDRINRMFEQSLGDLFPTEEELGVGMWRPSADIYETDDSYVVSADLPGMNKDYIQIEMRNGRLRIRGEKKFEKETSPEEYVRRERTHGEFMRSFAIPQNVDTTNIKAKYENGVLEVTIPKTEESKPKRIEVETH